MTLVETRLESNRRKFPRLFLAHQGASTAALVDLMLLWSDRLQTPVLDLSEAGILVHSQGLLGHVRIGQVLDVKLRWFGKDPCPLRVKVLRMSGPLVLLSLDSLTLAGRLKMEQEDRERLIRDSWRAVPTEQLGESFRRTEWWHSAFDTNIWLEKSAGGAPERVIVEFESVAFVFDAGGRRFVKAPAAFDESKGYVGPFLDPLPHRVSPGRNWSERLLKLLSSSALPTVVADVVKLHV